MRAGDLAPKPRTLDHVHAAAVPLSALTAWQLLLIHAGLSEGQRVLIHGTAGAVVALLSARRLHRTARLNVGELGMAGESTACPGGRLRPSVLGPYHLRERIGAGGKGEVYLAEHQLPEATQSRQE